MFREICDFVEANGAVNARLVQLSYAGMASGMAALTWELDNMRANARRVGVVLRSGIGASGQVDDRKSALGASWQGALE